MSAHDNSTPNGAAKIGVYVCHCGRNIAGKVDVESVVAFASGLPHVAVARNYTFMCSDPGQELIEQDIRDGRGQPRRRRLVLTADARADVPPRERGRRAEPLPGSDGEHPRAGELGDTTTRLTLTRRRRRLSLEPYHASPHMSRWRAGRFPSIPMCSSSVPGSPGFMRR